jgi:hypothetical protein
MKKLALAALLAASVIGSSAQAYDCRYHDCYHGRPGYGGGYDDGFFAGMLASTMLVLFSDTLFHHGYYKELIALGADEDAAAFLATGEQPTAVLQQVMAMERKLVDAAGVKEKLSDEDVAYLIIQRAALLK